MRREIRIGDLVKVKRPFSKDYYPGRVIYVFEIKKFGSDIPYCEVEYSVEGNLRIDTFDMTQLDFDTFSMRDKLLKELGL